ncbi:site-specific DNA-methyltransferase [Mesorhizobium sp. M6A.T.Ce.TU.016.01.1.1]|uniref:DNA-methyltransferase n=1 Tax=Mesorhizobium sp. M6A.T.Ce.TU.016.01.1.1 TaxID=2496783 RepID=UPI000FCC94AB|nr:site-specific DNA-methyltransferase [Mesorhizobium sp. M6A.T.Ce.TU.016.01.1.1]RUU29740.1 site-specific DNA-methyltransferase [Mesorhizobium sp. M6A.T.Ce.TU.016.01.1.1]
MTRLLLGAAADVLRREIATASVDMVYSDPPFGNEQIWTGKAGSFDDRWEWSAASSTGWAALKDHSAAGAALLAAVARSAPSRAYLGVMAGIIVELRRVLKLTGTLWLHFDDTMGAELRVLCDVIFGAGNAIGTLVWVRTLGGHGNSKRFGRVHDTIACYGRSRAAKWRLWRIGTLGGDPITGDGFGRFDDFAIAAPLGPTDKERVGYPTQKPVALLEELIRAATLPGNVLLDPTCGSGTALVAATRLQRKSIGIDISQDALTAAQARLTGPATAQPSFDFGEVA